MGKKRVFKKASRKERFTIFLGKRCFIESGNEMEEIDGVLKFDAPKARDQPLFIAMRAFLEFGTGSIDMLGIKSQSLLYSTTQRVFPEQECPVSHPSRLQKKLISKLGAANSIPFTFKLPSGTPQSVTLHMGEGESEEKKVPSGVHWEIVAYSAEMKDSPRSNWRDKVHLGIRKLNNIALPAMVHKPFQEVRKKYALSSGELVMKVELSKEVYYAGEPIEVTLDISNGCKKTIKNVELRVRQFATVLNGGATVLTNKAVVAATQNTIGFPVQYKGSLHEVYDLVLTPSLGERCVALDGADRDGDSVCLAGTTLLSHTALDESLGMKVSYDVKVKVNVGLGNSITCKLPVVITRSDTLSDYDRPEEKKTNGGDDDDGLEIQFEQFIEMRAQAFFSNSTEEGTKMES
eukprot:m.97143 g.97143  ORF g.97143 m.97143 type:complete len:405 (-) comp8981_c0_seq2:532-1746(-)